MNKPKVSIIIPVYNGENYLKEAIDSAIAQTYPNIEIIVVNDGSEDGGITESIALSYDAKIRYFYKHNGGVATALNMGIKNMEGEYFSWLSHDDIYYPNKIEKQIQVLRESGNVTVIIHSDYDLLEVNSKSLTHVEQSKMYPVEKLTNTVFPVLQGLVYGCSLLIHKSHFDRVGVFNEKLITTQDYDFWFRLMRNQTTIYISEPLAMCRIHDSQGSQTLTCYKAERSELHINFLRNLSDKEIYFMYDSPYIFYHKMCCFFAGAKMYEGYNYANEKLKDIPIPANNNDHIFKLQEYIKVLSNGNANRICIFGAGEYGIRLYLELYSRLICVDCFADNNPNKWGGLINNIYCISPKKLEKDKENTLVIVAMRTPSSIVKQLKSEGFSYIITKQEIDSILLEVPPVRNIDEIENVFLEKID